MGIFAMAMTTEITIETHTGVDDYGDESWGAPRSILCRLEVNGERIRDASGVILDARDIIYSESPIYKTDRITFADGEVAVATQATLTRTIGGGGQPFYKAVL